MVLSNPHSLRLQQPVLFLSRRKSVATGLASYNSPNGYESIDYAAMAYEVLPFKVFVFIFKCKLRNALHAYTYKELCCQNRSAPVSIDNRQKAKGN
jgi:hypothetical protein